MRPTLLAVLLLSALAVVAPRSDAQGATQSPAQTGRAGKPDQAEKPNRPAKLRPDAVFAGVTLEPGQRAQGTALVARSQAAFQAILARQTPGTALSAADRAALQKIGEEHNASYRALLTDAQRTRLDANLAALRPATTTPAPSTKPAIVTPVVK